MGSESCIALWLEAIISGLYTTRGCRRELDRDKWDGQGGRRESERAMEERGFSMSDQSRGDRR